MSNILIILLYFVFNYFIDKTECNGYQPKNALFTADFSENEEFILSGTHDYIRVSVAKDITYVGRNTFPKCLAVGCTKTALICEQKSGKVMPSFATVNGTQQAYFKSTMVNYDMILSVNCRPLHTTCCFEDYKKLNAVPLPSIRPQPTSTTIQQNPYVLPNTPIPTSPPKPIKYINPIQRIHEQRVTNTIPVIPTPPKIIEYNSKTVPIPTPPPVTSVPLTLPPIPTPPPVTSVPLTLPPIPTQQSTTVPQTSTPNSTDSKPIKIFLFSNICIGFLGGAGWVDCNG